MSIKKSIALCCLVGTGCVAHATETEHSVTDDVSTQVAKKRDRRGKKPGLDEKTQAILAHFANIMMGFFGITQAPNNIENVTSNVSNMFAGAMNIVAEAVKAGELSLQATEEEIEAFAQKMAHKIGPMVTKMMDFEID